MSGRSARLIEIAHRERGVLQQQWLVAVVGVAQQEGLAARTEEAQVASGIHPACIAAVRAQGRDRTVDGEALCNASEIECQARAARDPRRGSRRGTRELEIAHPSGT